MNPVGPPSSSGHRIFIHIRGQNGIHGYNRAEGGHTGFLTTSRRLTSTSLSVLESSSWSTAGVSGGNGHTGCSGSGEAVSGADG